MKKLNQEEKQKVSGGAASGLLLIHGIVTAAMAAIDIANIVIDSTKGNKGGPKNFSKPETPQFNNNSLDSKITILS